MDDLRDTSSDRAEDADRSNVYEASDLADRTVEAETQGAELAARQKNGANWFYWIAAFSTINYLLIAFGSEINFIVGLGVTTLAAAFSQIASNEMQGNAVLVVKVIGFVISLGATGVFALFGFLSGKGHVWAFVLGMMLYALDGLLFVWLEDWISVGFHAFALFCLYSGLTAARQIAANQEGSRHLDPSGN